MTPFNLAAAKLGAPVQTRDQRPVRIVCFDVRNVNYKILALVTTPEGTEFVSLYTPDGRQNCNTSCNSLNDLFMA